MMDVDDDPHTAQDMSDDPNVALLAVTSTDNFAIHADLTGRFPVNSRRGNAYILVTTYRGYIHMEAMPSRHATAYTTAVQNTLNFFRNLGHTPTYFRLDNETSRQLERLLTSERLTIEYVPPNNHRANRAERAIRSAKNHIIASLCTTHPLCPLNLWDDFLPQIEITLNLLRPATHDNRISAYHHIHHHSYDFNAHPIAPVGTQVLVHDAANNRSSWAPHGTPGFYTGPALNHYRSYRVYMPTTTTERISDTLAWLPVPFHMPGSTIPEIILDALTTTQNLLQSQQPNAATETLTDLLSRQSP
jgi:hypothetical protein